MKIRNKIILSIAIVSFIFMILIYLWLSNLILSSFTQLESKAISGDLVRVVDILNQKIKQLYSTSLDWAHWDDTYNFMLMPEKRQNYIVSNMMDVSFANLEVNFILLYNLKKQLVYGKNYDLINNREVPIPAGLSNYLLEHDFLFKHQDNSSFYKGFILIPEGLLMLISVPIMNSYGAGEIRGTLFMGKYFNSQVIEELEEYLKLRITLEKLAPDFLLNQNVANQDSPIFIETINQGQITANTLIKDPTEKPIYLLRVTQNRYVYQEAKKSIKYFIISLILLGMIFIILLINLLDRVIIERLLNIIQALKIITLYNYFEQRLQVKGTDELAVLTNNINSLLENIEIYTQELNAQVFIDGLTRIPNRRKFNEYLRQQWGNCFQKQQPISLILCDIDFFKEYNYVYGHLGGDDCLIKIATILNNSWTTTENLVARYGGEEFAIVLPNTSSQQAQIIANQIKEDIKKAQIVHKLSPINDYVTVSMGIATLIPKPGLFFETLIQMADNELYKAKDQGRDRLCVVDLTCN